MTRRRRLADRRLAETEPFRYFLQYPKNTLSNRLCFPGKCDKYEITDRTFPVGRCTVGILHEFDVLSMITELTGRGLSVERIERTLQELVGRDWKEINHALWRRRLQARHVAMHDDRERFLNDLEELVKRVTAPDELDNRGHRWGRA